MPSCGRTTLSGMLHQPESPIPFPCPHCGKNKGFPIGIAVERADTVVAVIRCKQCECMWQVNRERGQAWPARVATVVN